MIAYLRRRPNVLAYVALAVAVLAMATMVFRQSAITDFKLCEDQQENRQALRDVIVLATEQTGGGLNLTAIPSFGDLEPEMQQYLRDLEALSNARSGDGDGGFRDQALGVLPLEDCEHLQPWP